MQLTLRPAMLFFAFCMILCIIGCIHYSKYIPNPEKDVELWIANFSNQRSFSYMYTMKTYTVHTQARGYCVIDRGEHIDGTWEQEGQILPFEYIGVKDCEYSKQGDKWLSASRGEQSDILIQIERLLQFDEFEYQGANGLYVYHFKANIPFLAPGRWKEMIGIMEISKRYCLPVKIWAGLPDSSVSWTIELFDFNKKKSIDIPRVSWHSFYVQSEEKNLDDIIGKRLHALDIDYRLKETDQGMILSVPEYCTLDDVEMMMKNHTITVYRLTHEKKEAILIGFLRDDKQTPVYCAETLCTQTDIKSISIKFDPAYRPLILTTFYRKKYFPPEIAVAIDGVIQHLAVLDSDEKINTLHIYTNMHYFELQLLKASIMHVLPHLEIKAQGGELR